jgi:hypothetical protein
MKSSVGLYSIPGLVKDAIVVRQSSEWTRSGDGQYRSEAGFVLAMLPGKLLTLSEPPFLIYCNFSASRCVED